MDNAEKEARRKAVLRVLAGEPPSKVAADFGRTDRWVRKWVTRYDPANEAWAAGLSRAPRTQAAKTPEDIKRVVLEIRERLMSNPWAQVGAVTIAWEMDKLGVAPLNLRTIERILTRAGVPKRRARNRYAPKGTPYPPGPLLIKPNAVHEIDLVGPSASRRRRALLRAQRDRPRAPARRDRDHRKQAGMGRRRRSRPAMASPRDAGQGEVR